MNDNGIFGKSPSTSSAKLESAEAEPAKVSEQWDPRGSGAPRPVGLAGRRNRRAECRVLSGADHCGKPSRRGQCRTPTPRTPVGPHSIWRSPKPRGLVVRSSPAASSSPATLAQLIVRNLEDDIRDKLRALAAAHGRSMEEEVREILRAAALTMNGPSEEKLGTRLIEHFRGFDLEEGVIQELRGQPARPAEFD